MRRLDLTLPGAADNLALDEALLDEADANAIETLRFWEPSTPMVVVGRSSQIADEVRLEACRRLGIPTLRRASGGAAIVTGPGCLMYALALDLRRRGALRSVAEAHRQILGALVGALRPLAATIVCRGTSDLALGLRKVSGNSLRRKRHALLYHGTLLYRFPLDLIETCLTLPPRQPDYRQRRDHLDFVANLDLDVDVLRQAIASAWQAEGPAERWPEAETAALVAGRYGRPEWNLEGRTFGSLPAEEPPTG